MPFKLLIPVRISFVFLAVILLALPAFGQVGTCDETQAEAFLEAGNIRAPIYNNGALFWNRSNTLYEVPKGSGISAMFTSTFVLGGLINGSLRSASSTFGPYEFWPGPLDSEGNPPDDCSTYDEIWEIRSDDFALYDQQGIVSDNLLNWPWHLGAPVVDGDGNPNNYNLKDGDRPELLGDQLLWWIMNDRGSEHEWSKTQPIGLEVRASAFAFVHARSGGDITFYRYHLTNKNTAPLTDAYAGMFLDPDLGNAADDHMGSDSLLHLGYTYNGDPLDENGYEDTPPAIGYTFLLTPEAQRDSIDNDYDGQVDEPGETAGMHAAIPFEGGGGIQGDPGDGAEMYTFLQGLWQNGDPMTVGGNGAHYSNKPTRYAYSGDPITQPFWTERQPYSDSSLGANPPGDKRFLVTSGPFTLLPGESTEILLALVWARGSNYLDSVRKLKGIVGNMQATPSEYLVSGYRPELLTPPPSFEFPLGFDQNFPNPFTWSTTIRYSLPKPMQVRLAVYDLLGREIEVLAQGDHEAGTYSLEFDGSQLPPGIYYARIELDHYQFTRKLVRIP
ncbi:MAG: T9SS type A sorting domain-containing protein [Rhodothermaceae bacterium]|nr:T9SS type A sorting domain-containing protein [Rhodothermaceae bacterium]